MLKDKVLEGYMYGLLPPKEVPEGYKRITMYTGKGGVLLYIDKCIEAGIPEQAIAESIEVHTDEFVTTLDKVIVKK